MRFASKKLNFGLVVALLFGWGALGLLLIESSKELFQAQILESESQAVKLPKGIRMKLVVDKNVYGSDETILISVRNDSRKPVWLAERADGCHLGWWQLETLGSSETWEVVALKRNSCNQLDYGVVAFPTHSLKTEDWDGLIQTTALGETYQRVPTGTYRIRVPFLHGAEVDPASWPSAEAAVSTSFTILGPETGS